MGSRDDPPADSRPDRPKQRQQLCGRAMTMVNLLNRLQGLRRSRKAWTSKCPAHEERQNSLSVSHRDDKWLIKYHSVRACEAVCMAAGKPCDRRVVFSTEITL